MKLTKQRLKQIILEETIKVLQEKGSAWAVCMGNFTKKYGKPGPDHKKNWSKKTKTKFKRCAKKVASGSDYSLKQEAAPVPHINPLLTQRDYSLGLRQEDDVSFREWFELVTSFLNEEGHYIHHPDLLERRAYNAFLFNKTVGDFVDETLLPDDEM